MCWEAALDFGLKDIAVIVGGIVPDADEAMLLESGVAKVFHPGSALDEIAADIGRLTGARRAHSLSV